MKRDRFDQTFEDWRWDDWLFSIMFIGFWCGVSLGWW